jgi:uncharacterized membrane protein
MTSASTWRIGMCGAAVGLILARTMMTVAALLAAIAATRLPLRATIATGVLWVVALRALA